MEKKNVWFITGAGRGMGIDIAKAALAEGYQVVATGRDPEKVTQVLGENVNLLVVKLDITSPSNAEAAVKTAVEHFGTIDVLVNNAGNFYAGYFEEISPDQIEKQLATNFMGPLNVTRAVLPVMRKAHFGHIISMSSIAGLVGGEFTSAYAASKFALEGWMESLRFEVEPFGIKTTIVEPGFFRTDLLEPESRIWPELSVEDYKERSENTRAGWDSMSGKQGGDPAKLAKALMTIANQEEPPLRWIAGADAIAAAEQKVADLQKQINAYRELSTSLAHEEA